MVKKIACGFLILGLVAFLCACGNSSNQNAKMESANKDEAIILSDLIEKEMLDEICTNDTQLSNNESKLFSVFDEEYQVRVEYAKENSQKDISFL